MTHILVIDDEPQIRKLLEITLHSNGFEVVSASTAREGLALCASRPPELVLLDLGLPDGDGQDVLVQLREWYTRPILIVSVRNAEEEIIKALDHGANDYLVKPFRMAELAARIRSLERRAERPYAPQHLSWGPLCIDVDRSQASLGGSPLVLTSKELQLLEWFLRHPGRLASRHQLLDQLWSMDAEAGEETVKTHLNNLRRKLRASGCPDPIETAHGQGYRLRSAP